MSALTGVQGHWSHIISFPKSVFEDSFLCHTDNEEHFDVLSALTPLSARWKEVGAAFRITQDRVARIAEENHQDPSRCLSGVITEWMKKNYNTDKFGQPSWKFVVKVVGAQAGGNDVNLALKIAGEHPGE